jgi:hypothetical protein
MYIKGTRGRRCYFNASMDALASKWHPHNDYPVILMDTKRWTRNDMVAIKRTWSMLDFKFLNIKPVWNSVPRLSESQFEDAVKPLSSIDYKRMCHFFFKGFTQIPFLMEYKYLMRFDEDTCVVDNINYDIFIFLEHKQATYAHTDVWLDAADVTFGLSDFASEYAFSNKLDVQNPDLNATRDYHSAFNTNLEVINTVNYRDEDVSRWVEAVDRSDMIFHRRWGDAPLRHATAMLFWSPSDM